MIEGFVSSKEHNAPAFHLRGKFDCISFLGGEDAFLVASFLSSDHHEGFEGTFFVNGTDYFEKKAQHLCLENFSDWDSFQNQVEKTIKADSDFCFIDFSKLNQEDEERASRLLLGHFPQAHLLAFAPFLCPLCAGISLFPFYLNRGNDGQKTTPPTPFSRLARDLTFNESPFYEGISSFEAQDQTAKVLSPTWIVNHDAPAVQPKEELIRKTETLEETAKNPDVSILPKAKRKQTRVTDFKAQWPTFVFFLLFALLPFAVFWISYFSIVHSSLFLAFCLLLNVCFCFLQGLCVSFLKKDGSVFTLKLALACAFSLSFVGISMSALTAALVPGQATQSYFCILFGLSPLASGAPLFLKGRKKKKGL